MSPNRMEPDAVIIEVPRQPFLGWMLSVASFKAAGVGNVLMTFDHGQLHLASQWGETTMSYTGDFTGTVTVTEGTLGTLVKRQARKIDEPAPFRFCLEPSLGNLCMEAFGIRAVIRRTAPPSAPQPAVPAEIGWFKAKVLAGDLQRMLQEILPKRKAAKGAIYVTVTNGCLGLQVGVKQSSTIVKTEGQGQFVLQAQMLQRVLDTYSKADSLDLRASADGLELNSFRMPVSGWKAVP